MRLTRIYTSAPLQAGARTSLAGQAARHATRVLRLRTGDSLALFNGDGWDYPGIVASVGTARVEVTLQDRVAALPESPLALTLVQGISRGERMDFVMQKGTELGLARFVPVLTARSVVRLDARQAARRAAHWQSVIVGACEQCGRARLPGLEAPQALEAWLAQPAQGEVRRLMLAPDGAAPLARLAAGANALELLVGPEGGLDAAERAAAIAAGYQAASLGPRILRTETAALTAIAALQTTLGDLR